MLKKTLPLWSSCQYDIGNARFRCVPSLPVPRPKMVPVGYTNI